jgi:hypothetical protein
LGYHFELGKHDIFILFCQSSEDAKETVKFIIDGKPVYYEIPGEFTIWLEDSGEVASLHTGDDPGKLTLTPVEKFILAGANTKRNQKMAVKKEKSPHKSRIRVPDQVLVENEAGKLVISWPWYDSIFRKDLIGGLILVLIGMIAGYLIIGYIANWGALIWTPLIFFVPGYLILKKSFEQYRIVIEDQDLEVFRGLRGSKFVNAVNLVDVEKFEIHDPDSQNKSYYPQLCALKKSGEHEELLTSGSNEVLAYLESELNLVLHCSEHKPPQRGG